MQNINIILLPQQAANDNEIEIALRKQLHLTAADRLAFSIQKKSIDARQRSIKIQLSVNYSINSELEKEEAITLPLQQVGNCKPLIIVGCGPAGMFAALKAIEKGLKPIVIEQGKNVRDRRRDLAAINKQRIVNPHSNYCFGEGGAGTYSDGKLYTRSDKRGNVKSILNTLVYFGATSQILIEAHPHIGTNKLPVIIEKMRDTIIDCGGEIHYNTSFQNFLLRGKTIEGVNVKDVHSGHTQTIAGNAVILATGHSARDVFEYLHREKIAIEAKPFALGVRIEHPQSLIDQLQYHCDVRDEYLPPASYKLAFTSNDNRGVYSFCMCPGGIIAPAATAPNELVVNGWSPSRRNNPFANSGMVISINEDDFAPYAKHGELRALQFQKEIEKKCFEAGGSNLTAPAQRVMDFWKTKNHQPYLHAAIFRGISSAALTDIMPTAVTEMLKTGLKNFGNKMRGYLTNEAVLVATESRTSSPVRIPRLADTLQHSEIVGLYPCAEGAGYAGGIVSAAIDGERCAAAACDFLTSTSN
ncbi:MAG: FAD-binding protein [Bacteroidetes bacterium]|nr:FAD-binding protein [Bacteroidota bacterium]